MDGQSAKYGVENFGEQWRGVRACDGVIFKQKETGEGQVSPEASPLEIVCEAQESQH